MRVRKTEIYLITIIFSLFLLCSASCFQPTLVEGNLINIQEIIIEERSDFPPKGRINDFKGYLSEKSAGARFRTAFSSFDDYWIRYNWQDVLGGCSDYGISYPDPSSKSFKPMWLSDHGLRLSMQIFGEAVNPFDIFYNETYRQVIISNCLENFNSIEWHDLVEELIIGDEAPATLFEWFAFSGEKWPERITKYNNTIFTETGIYMRPSYDNLTESWIFENWLTNRTMSAMNYLYEGLKFAYPDINISWGTMPWPGYELTLLKSDSINGGYYTNDFRKFYAMIRHACLINPELPVISVIMGDDDPNNPLGMPLTVQKQFFWTAYFAGGSKVSWFDAGSNKHWTTIGDDLDFSRYQFHCELNRLANTLPVIDVTPLVLDIGAIRGSDVLPAVGFREFDSATQIQVMRKDFSLNQYKVVVLDDQFLMCDAVTQKLTDFIKEGGNIILKGTLQIVDESLNASGHLRSFFLPLEEDFLTKVGKDDSQLLDLQDNLFETIVPNLKAESRCSINFTASENWETITTGMPEEAQGYWPIALFHNNSLPNSGYLLYYGFDSTLDEDLYIPLIHNFINEFLGVPDVTSPVEHPNWLISTGLDNDKIIVGIIPDDDEGAINIPIDIYNRDLPPNIKWMYQGFEKEIWLGELSKSLEINSFFASVTANEPQRWVLTPEFPTPNLQIHSYFPDVSPYVGETIPISIEVFETLEHVSIDDLEIQLKLPTGLSLAPNSQPVIQSIPELPSMEECLFYWSVAASSPQLYSIEIEINASTLPSPLHYSMTIRVFPGRLEIFCPSIFYYTLADTITFNCTLIYYGSEPREFSISDCIQDYIWGNPGGFLENITMHSGKSYELSYVTSPKNHRIGETAIYHIFAVDSEEKIWAEEYLQVEILPAMLKSSNILYSDGMVSVEVTCVGTDYITNVIASLTSDEVTIENSVQYLGTLAAETKVIPSWIIPTVNYQISIKLVIMADNLPYSIKKRAIISFFPTSQLTSVEESTTTTTTATKSSGFTLIISLSVLAVIYGYCKKKN